MGRFENTNSNIELLKEEDFFNLQLDLCCMDKGSNFWLTNITSISIHLYKKIKIAKQKIII